MAAKTGSNTSIIFKEGATHGTAIQGTTGDKIVVESFNHNANPTALRSNSIGAGKSMQTSVIRGQVLPTVSLSMFGGFDNNFDTQLAVFLGAASSPAEQTGGEGDYLHRLTYDPTELKFGTIAAEGDSAEVFEYASCYPTSVNISTGPANGYLTGSFEYIADQRIIDSTTNTNASLASATVADADDEDVIIHNFNDEFLINTSGGGALSSPTDRVSITELELNLTDGKEFVPEFKGSLGHSAPRRTDLFTGTLTVQFKEQDGFTWFDAEDAETEYKCSFTIEGAVIASGVARSFAIFIPRMKIVESPEYNLTSPGVNPMTVSFEIIEAASNPTGLSDTTPYFEIINESSTQITT